MLVRLPEVYFKEVNLPSESEVVLFSPAIAYEIIVLINENISEHDVAIHGDPVKGLIPAHRDRGRTINP